MTSTSFDADVDDAIRTLPVAEKIRLLSGSGLWFTQAEPRLGLPKIAVSDGPVGVRGHRDSEAAGSVNLPSATCLASSWDRRLMARVGRLLAAEARRQEVDVVLGPTMNLHRSPLAGRNFECLSEDPLLTGELAAAYVDGIQGQGIGACPKHFVANEAETERMTVNNLIDERTLHEVYLAPFERVVKQARPWMIMAAYNGVNGKPMTENPLTENPLKTEWGFDGAVVSDWHAVYSTVDSALSATDLAMPGPEELWGDPLVKANASGLVPEAVIDGKVRRLLALGRRVEEGRRQEPAEPKAGPEAGAAVAREAAAAGFVLLENHDRILPLAPRDITSLAVIGPAAMDPRTQGGGSASVFPSYTVAPAAGLRARLGDGAQLTTVQGAWLSDGLREPRDAECHAPGQAPGSGQRRVRLTWRGAAGTLAEEYGPRTTLTRGAGAIPDGATAVDIETIFTPQVSGLWKLGFKAIGHATLEVNGESVAAADSRHRYADIEAVLIGAPEEAADVELAAGEPVRLTLHYTWHPDATLFRVGLAVDEPREPADLEIVKAAAAAGAADVAVVMVGTSGAVESEGFDRTSLALPGRQDDLVRAVIAANPRTVVVVNAGAPVEMPWRNDAAAVLLVWFPGMEFGNALADVLFGDTEPGGHLPTTWPAALADAPVRDTRPRHGRLEYTERLHVGYRGWARQATHASQTGQPAAPAYWLGHGLGYTTFAVDGFRLLGAPAPGDDLQAVLTVRNTGSRAGKYLAQIYADAPESAVERPDFWLAGFATALIPAGERREITVTLPGRTFQHWNAGRGWCDEATTFRIAPAEHAGAAPAALSGPLAVSVTLAASTSPAAPVPASDRPRP
ncbi:beta-glucosidase family protein [Arthrobacter sp. H-02-3]|uniref:beta-glucosidase family protein n=1 Tax=Arthrobacter sp. H-02-3 TaxID=2703675 RepID=UPI000DD1A6E8|nr:glycoside hydrolase family 3 C-terminal domain-containing protein [Arthrobacter sp. H-02-3]PVZ59641.1 glycosyl hydrolase [Arthrobacter sp. H-02-3]